MKKSIFAFTFLILAATVFSYGQSNAWNNLIPLYSTRAEAEKLLGKPDDSTCKFGCKYKFAADYVSVEYAGKTCDASGWNVSPGTVLSIEVYPKEGINKSFDELNLNRKKFSVSVNDTLSGSWVNPEEGLSYYFGNFDKMLESVTYLPKKSDNNLRCDGFPPFAPEGDQPILDETPFFDAQVGKKESLYNVFQMTDDLAVRLRSSTYTKEKYKGYILVYFDRKLPFKEYKSRLGKLKAHLQRRKISPESITVTEGGMTENSRVEFYFLPKGWIPPSPNPTLPSPQFLRKQ